MYVDDACIISSHQKDIESEINPLQLDYDLSDEGDLLDYLGTRFDRMSDGFVSLTQPRMIERVLKLVGFSGIEQNVIRINTPATTILDKDPDGKPQMQKWHYRSVLGCLSYMHATVRPGITFVIQ